MEVPPAVGAPGWTFSSPNQSLIKNRGLPLLVQQRIDGRCYTVLQGGPLASWSLTSPPLSLWYPGEAHIHPTLPSLVAWHLPFLHLQHQPRDSPLPSIATWGLVAEVEPETSLGCPQEAES